MTSPTVITLNFEFNLLKDELPKGYNMWSGERLTKIQATTRPENLLPEVWSKMGKSSSEDKKARMGTREAQTRQCSKIELHLFHRLGRCGIYRNQKRNEKVGSSNGGGNALQKRTKEELQLSGH